MLVLSEAGGAVGQEMIRVLEKSPVPIAELRLFAQSVLPGAG